jgi:hypothetical protein
VWTIHKSGQAGVLSVVYCTGAEAQIPLPQKKKEGNQSIFRMAVGLSGMEHVVYVNDASNASHESSKSKVFEKLEYGN